MALINCEECCKEVSDKASVCPNCGAPVQGAAQETADKPSLWDAMSRRSGQDEVVVRGTDVGYEAQKLTERLILMVVALFLHPAFSFVGFWLICTGLLLTLGSVIGAALGSNLDSPPTWFILLSMAASGALTVSLKKYVPTVMKWVFYLLVGALALAIIGGIISGIMSS